jgi:hypothetical protein
MFAGAESVQFCEPCSRGRFNVAEGSATCTACSDGTITAADGATECVACEAGTFTLFTDRTQCTRCPDGTQHKGVECVQCNHGYFSLFPTTDGMCTACPPDTYQPDVGMSTCLQCALLNGTGDTWNDFCAPKPNNHWLKDLKRKNQAESLLNLVELLGATALLSCIIMALKLWPPCHKKSLSNEDLKARILRPYLIKSQAEDGPADEENQHASKAASPASGLGDTPAASSRGTWALSSLWNARPAPPSASRPVDLGSPRVVFSRRANPGTPASPLSPHALPRPRDLFSSRTAPAPTSPRSPARPPAPRAKKCGTLEQEHAQSRTGGKLEKKKFSVLRETREVERNKKTKTTKTTKTKTTTREEKRPAETQERPRAESQRGRSCFL